jgi:arylsulfatase A-like enzyme
MNDHKLKETPNLVFIYPDQMRASAMGFLKEEPVITPNLDLFAEESMVLPEAASNYPVCVPFRTILMTGKYPINNGVRVNCFCDGRDLPNHHIWWTDILQANGYSVGYLGKWHISKPQASYQGRNLKGASAHWLSPERRHGIDYWEIHCNNNHMDNTYVFSTKEAEDTENIKEWTPSYETNRAIEYLENKDNSFRDQNKPFALTISFNPPHTPYNQVPKKYLDMYDKDIEEYCKGIGNVPPAGTVDGDYYRANIRQYYAAITGIDYEFGRIMKSLKEQGLYENTIVVFTSDHGDLMGRHISWDHKNFPWEESMRIPMLVRWPGKIKPDTDNLLFSTADYYPTILDLMGLKNKLSDDLEGESYAPLLLGKDQKRPESQIYMHIEEPAGDPHWGRRGVRTKRYTLSINKMRNKPVECWLYDRRTDPWQLSNIAKDNREVVESLINQHLKPWLQKINDPFIIPDIEVYY